MKQKQLGNFFQSKNKKSCEMDLSSQEFLVSAFYRSISRNFLEIFSSLNFQPFQLTQPRPDVKDGSSAADANPGAHLRVQSRMRKIRCSVRQWSGSSGSVRVELSRIAEKYCSRLLQFRGSGRSGERDRRVVDVTTTNGSAGMANSFVYVVTNVDNLNVERYLWRFIMKILHCQD